MSIIAIDLGTTNIKVSVYDKSLAPLNTLSETVNYNRNGELVEFNVDQYFICIKEMINKTAEIGKRANNENIIQIVLTGQAETLIWGSDQLLGHPKPLYCYTSTYCQTALTSLAVNFIQKLTVWTPITQ
ncbi:hypothetical protein [Photorhabdus antumapuensis]|uniref:hypothetical protein n=1 Tax=Photorhabdus antumapuensis TaxID=2862867 RepID=UPI001CEE03A5|nr:hypothetical protein [Photorhabdus antumapuensis]MCA6222978.1 hypothetical protein [Photorhabdus antumapuensis]